MQFYLSGSGSAFVVLLVIVFSSISPSIIDVTLTRNVAKMLYKVKCVSVIILTLPAGKFQEIKAYHTFSVIKNRK